MSSIFSNSPLWSGDHCYITAHADFLHHQIDPAQLNVRNDLSDDVQFQSLSAPA